MPVYALADPAPALSSLIERYWFVADAPGEAAELAVDVYVDGQADLVLNHGVPYRRVDVDGREREVPFSAIDAQRTRPVQIRQTGGIRVCGARFRPGGLAAFTDRPMAPLTDRVEPVEAVFGDGIRPVVDAVGRHYGDHESQARMLDEYFLAELRESAPYRTFRVALAAVDEVIDAANPIGAIATRAGCTVRTVQRLFARYLGCAPRFYLRVARFQRAVRAMMDDPTCDLAATAVAAGYYDQSHLVRDFHTFAGGVPRRFRGYLPEEGRDFAPNVVRYSADHRPVRSRATPRSRAP